MLFKKIDEKMDREIVCVLLEEEGEGRREEGGRRREERGGRRQERGWRREKGGERTDEGEGMRAEEIDREIGTTSWGMGRRDIPYYVK